MTGVKRASPHSSVEDVNKKRLKTSSDHSVAPTKLAGIVERVVVKNFMCHTSLAVTLNENVNFIVGRNGSGKSAILAAVIIALGGKATHTNRASSVKDFIKIGTHSASVQVTLSNEGLHAYKPEVYGSKITVVRNIYSASTQTNYKIKSATGEVISAKREELDKIIDAFNIQIDNPISVLTQDNARTFLTSSDPKAKYAIFMKATLIEDVYQLHARTKHCEATVISRLNLRKQSMKYQEMEIAELKSKRNVLRKLEEYEKKAVHLDYEIFWAQARDMEQVVTDLTEKIEKEKENEALLLMKLKKSTAKLDKKKSTIREIYEQLDVMNENIVLKNKCIMELKKDLKEMTLTYRNALQKYKVYEKEEQKYKADILTVQKEIEKQRVAEENINERNRLEKIISDLKNKLLKVIAAQGTTEMEYQNLQTILNRCNEEEKEVQKEEREKTQSIVLKKKHLEGLLTQSHDLTIYGHWMPPIVERIDVYHREGRFVRKPVGPLGAYIKVKDGQWTNAIESQLYGSLRSFGVHCVNDTNVLREIFKSCIKERSSYPGILSCRFYDKVHDTSARKLKSSSYKSILDVIECSNPNVLNFLIDNGGIENIMLVPTVQEATEIMSKNPPKNCAKCVTLTLDQFYPYPDFRMYSGNPRYRAKLLEVSKQDIIRRLKTEVEIEGQHLAMLHSKLEGIQKEKRINEERFKDVQRRYKHLLDSKSMLTTQISEIETAVDALQDPQQFQMLDTELKTLQEKIQEVMQKLREANEETDELNAKVKYMEEKLKKEQDELREMEGARRNVQEELGNQIQESKKAESKVQHHKILLQEHSTDAKKLMEIFKAQEKKMEEAVTKARSLCPNRIETNRSVNEIINEIKDIDNYKKSAKKNTGITDDIIDVLNEKKRKYQENLAQISRIESGLKVLEQSLLKRENYYKIIRRVIAMNVAYVFKPLLQLRGYQGNLEFDHEAKTLEIHIATDKENGQRETNALSGGERSYSTVSFILALWECVAQPFYLMDEFDVFTDNVNRRCMIEMLLQHARQKKRQYVFFTPQDTSLIQASDDTTIHKLDDPERNKSQ